MYYILNRYGEFYDKNKLSFVKKFNKDCLIVNPKNFENNGNFKVHKAENWVTDVRIIAEKSKFYNAGLSRKHLKKIENNERTNG